MDKIVHIISDTHNDHKDLDLPGGDILIHCGDVGTKGNYNEGHSFLWWFVKQPYKYKVVVPGNHDRKLQEHIELIRLAHDLGIHMLIDDPLELMDISMYGVCKTFWSYGRDGINNDDIRKQAWQNIPKDLDILITHSPPMGILDANQHGLPCGCPALTKKVSEVEPTYHVFGHIHEHGGKSLDRHNTRFLNTAVKNEMYLTVRGHKELIL